jgi:hypothetical protein
MEEKVYFLGEGLDGWMDFGRASNTLVRGPRFRLNVHPIITIFLSTVQVLHVVEHL